MMFKTRAFELADRLLKQAAEAARERGEAGASWLVLDEQPDRGEVPATLATHLQDPVTLRLEMRSRIEEGFTGVGAFTYMQKDGDGQALHAEAFDTDTRLSVWLSMPMRQASGGTYEQVGTGTFHGPAPGVFVEQTARAEPALEAPATCRACGQALREGSRFCGSCGVAVEVDQPAAAEPVVETPARPESEPAPGPDVAIAEPESPAPSPPSPKPFRFALIAVPTGVVTIDEVAARFDARMWLVPDADEQIVGRWTCLLMMAIVPAGGEAFRGAGTTVLTSRRMVGTLIQGKAGGRELDGRRGPVACFSLDLATLEEVTLLRKSSLGGPKDTGVLLAASDGSLLSCDLDRAVDDRMRSSRASRADAVRAVIAHAIAARGATAADSPQLADATTGRWKPDGDDLTARLVSYPRPE